MIRREVEERANSVIKELSEEVESLNEKLKKYKLICYYCGTRMNTESVNKAC